MNDGIKASNETLTDITLPYAMHILNDQRTQGSTNNVIYIEQTLLKSIPKKNFCESESSKFLLLLLQSRPSAPSRR